MRRDISVIGVLLSTLAAAACDRPTPTETSAYRYPSMQVGAPLGTPTWIQLFPTGGPPINRVNHVGVYDPSSNRMTIFGGSPFGIGTLTDTWVLTDANGLGAAPTWIQLTPTGGPPASGFLATAVYDPGTNRMMVFGGTGERGRSNEVWVLSAANGLGGTPTWVQLAPDGAAPSARFIHSAVYDPASNRMTIYGGRFLNDVWVLSNANGLGGTPAWTELLPVGGPPAQRENHSAVYDPTSNRMIVFGGENLSTGLYGEVWVLTNANGRGGTPTWIELSPGTGPGPRSGHGAVYDAAHNVMTIFGGRQCSPEPCQYLNEVWTLANANGQGGTPTWTQLFPAGGAPQGRWDMAMVYDPSNDRAIIQAGQDCSSPPGCSFPNDVWVLATASGITTLEVAIDIKPGSNPNSINPASTGVVPVAVLTDASFDAATVDVSTVRFGRTGFAEAAPVHSAMEDVDGDGDLDLVLQFPTQQTGLGCGATSASLTGKTLSGQPIQGSDAVRTVPCW